MSTNDEQQDPGGQQEQQSNPEVEARDEPPSPVAEPPVSPSGPAQFRVKIGSLGDPDSARQAKPRPTTNLYPSRSSAANLLEKTAEGGQDEPSPAATPPAASRLSGNAAQAESPTAELPPERAAKPHTAATAEAESPRPAPVAKPSRQLSPELEREVEEALGGMSLDAMLEGSVSADAGTELEAESRISGRVVSIHQEDVFVDLGAQNQGVVSIRQFAEPPKPGQALDLVVLRFDADEGLYELSVPGAAVQVEDWSQIEEGMTVQAVVTGHNKGGLEATVNNLRAFIPVSQVALFRIEDLEPFVGQSFTCVVAEANPERRNLVISRRAVLEREQAEAKQKMLESIAVGQTYDGVVRSLQNFGAFVDLGGIDGLIHISQLSWDRVNHPSEVLQLGQKVRVRVEKYDRTTGKIGLSYRDLADNPWNNVDTKYPAGSRVTGTVSKLMDFGAFVKLEPGVEGLVHISELSYRRVHRTSDVVSPGQEVEVQILSVDPQAQRIGLSLKALEEKPSPVDLEKKKEEEALAAIEGAPKPRKKQQGPLKGGLGGSKGGERFGLKW